MLISSIHLPGFIVKVFACGGHLPGVAILNESPYLGAIEDKIHENDH